MRTPLPDPENLANDVRFELACRATKQALQDVFKEMNAPFSVTTMLKRAGEILKSAGHEPDIITQALQGETVIAALKWLIQEGVAKKIDSDTFCRADLFKGGRRPIYRSLDAEVSPYVFKPQPDQPTEKLPTRKEVIADMARALPMVPEVFRMVELAEAWAQFADPKVKRALPEIFGIKHGRQIIMAIIKGLLDQKIIEQFDEWGEEARYTPVKPKVEKFRSLDDDWE